MSPSLSAAGHFTLLKAGRMRVASFLIRGRCKMKGSMICIVWCSVHEPKLSHNEPCQSQRADRVTASQPSRCDAIAGHCFTTPTNQPTIHPPPSVAHSTAVSPPHSAQKLDCTSNAIRQACTLTSRIDRHRLNSALNRTDSPGQGVLATKPDDQTRHSQVHGKCQTRSLGSGAGSTMQSSLPMYYKRS